MAAGLTTDEIEFADRHDRSPLNFSKKGVSRQEGGWSTPDNT